MSDDDIINQLSRLQWACRRGMLELDVLLGNFLKNHYASLPVEDKKLFVQLLSCRDPDLFAWLLGHQSPEDQGLKRITEIIRQHVRPNI